MMNMSFRYSDKKILEEFASSHHMPDIKRLHVDSRTIRYLSYTKDRNLPMVVFIHGAPGSGMDYKAYFKEKSLTDRFNIIAIDRPGYGYSGYGNSETSLDKQCKAIMEIIDHEVDHDKVIIVGHSYGGPIAVKLSMQYPERFSSVLLLAPAIDPEHEKTFAVARLGISPLTRWIAPPAWQVAADEKHTHVEELQMMLPDYNKVKIPVCHIHGNRDSLVPFENLDFATKQLDSLIFEAVLLENTDHFLPWSHQKLIVNKLLKMAIHL